MRHLLRLFVALSSLVAAYSVGAEPRVALIIGNSDYAATRLKLDNPANDAIAMQHALRDAGFETVVKLNATRKDFYRAVDEFAAKIGRDPHAVGLFYYAGHGVQADGANYLIPVDADIESDSDLEPSAFDAGRVLKAMKAAQNELNIVILDACRDNPLPKTRGTERGLARMDAPSGTFIAYAAAPGQTAHDGVKGANGVFTGELVKAMAESGLPLEQMFKRVITGVKAETHGQQQPWSEASIQGDFYFHAVPADASPRREQPISAAQSPASIHVPTAAELDESYWLAIKNSTDAADFAGYTKSFPTGMHLAESQMMMRRLSRSTTATAISHDAAAANPLSASTLSLRPGGPYPGWATTSLIPGFIGRGSVIVNRDGTIDTQAPDGTTTHTTVIIIDPDNITGTQITHLGKLRGLQNRYPDGTTSTQVTLQGRLIDGVLSGTWYDKFQNGQFQWTVGGTK